MKGVVLRQLVLKTLFTDGGARGMATGADIMCGRLTNGTGTPTLAQDVENIQIQQAAEPSSSSLNLFTTLSAVVNTPAVEVDVVELLKVPVTPQGSSSKWTSKWWRPDPATGTWVPEGQEGQVTTSTATTKSASRSLRVRSETSASMDDKRWWTSMEELPDMDRTSK